MPQSNFRRYYYQHEFALLVGGLAANLALIDTAMRALPTSVPIGAIALFGGEAGVEVVWDGLPESADIDALDALVPTIAGGTTTSQPFVYESFALATSISGTPVVKIDQTTPPLDAGTYQVSWVSNIQMQAAIANTGVQATIRLERLPDGAAVEQPDSWALNFPHAFNGSQPFQIAAGKRIRVLLTFARLGASGQAEMRGARITIDKVGELAA